MLSRNIVFGLLFSVLVLGLSGYSTAYADTFVATTSGVWSNPTIWDLGVVPTDADDAVIDSGVTVRVNTEFEITELTILSNGVLIVDQELIVYGIITNDGEIQNNNSWSIEEEFNNNNNFFNFGQLIIENPISTNSGFFNNTETGNVDANSLFQSTGTFHNFGTIDNNEDGNFLSLPGSFFINQAEGNISNFGNLTNFNSFLNNGEIANSGFIINNVLGTFTNTSTEFTFSCEGEVIGVITGVQPTTECTEGPPIFTSFPSDVVLSTDPGEAYAVYFYPYPTATDGGLEATVNLITLEFHTGAQFPLGVNTVTYRAIDADGEFLDASFTVTVNDLEPPVFDGVPDDISQDADPGLNSAVVTWTEPTATDNSGIAPIITSTHSPGDTFPLGDTTVTYTATDSDGNQAFDSFVVSIADDEPPVISGIPADITNPTEPGSSTATATWTEPTATDNSGIAPTLSSTHSPGDTFPLGDTTVTYTATDASGNITQEFFTVTVVDNQLPVISGTPSDFSQDNDPGLNSAIVIWTPPTATDNSGTVTLTSTHSPGDTFPLGDTTVTYTATDASGNITTSFFVVTINDVEPPVISDIPGDIMNPTDPGSNTATATWTEPTATDNSGIAPTLTSTHSPGDTFPLGDTTVTYTATDASGNITTSSFVVMINDSEVPIIHDIPADIFTSLPIGDSVVAVSWTEPTATDNNGIPTLSSTHSPGDLFSAGTTEVIYTATDSDGNQTEATFNVIVIASVFTAVQDGDWDDPATWGGTLPSEGDNKIIPDGITVSNTGVLTNSGTIDILGTLNNECGAFISNSGTIVNPVSEILCELNPISPLDGAQVNDVKPDLIWENPGEIRSIVNSPSLQEDTITPTLVELLSLSPVSAEPLSKISDGFFSWQVSVDLAADYDPGYPFTSVSNSISSTFEVVIDDVEPPVIHDMPDDFTWILPPGQTVTEVFWVAPTATDNVDDPGEFFFSSNKKPFNDFPEGVFEIIYTATDDAGNTTVESFILTVVPFDDEVPVIIGMPDDFTATLPKGDTTVPVSWNEPTATDNSGTVTLSSTHSPGDTFPLGDTIVTYTATDFQGNTTEESFTITVILEGKFVDPELQDLSNKQIKKFEKYIDKWEHEIEKLEKENIKLEEKAVKYENKGKQDKADSLREKILSNEAEIEVLEDQISVVQVSIGDLPEQSVEVEVQEDLSSKAYKDIEKDIKKWEKKLKYLNYAADKLEKKAQKYEDKDKLDKAEKIRNIVNGINAEINVIEDILEVLVCAIDFEQPDDHKPHHGHDHDNDDDKNGKGHDKHNDKYHDDDD